VDHARHAERIGRYAEAEACAREAMVIDPNDLAAAAFAWKMRMLRHAKDDRPVVRTAIMTTPDATPSGCDCCAKGKPCEPEKSAKAETTDQDVRDPKEEAALNRQKEADKATSSAEQRHEKGAIPSCTFGLLSRDVAAAKAAGGALARGVVTTICNPATAIAAAPVVPGLPEHPLPKRAKACDGACEDGQQACPLTLKEAIRIGLDNSEVVRVVTFGAASGYRATDDESKLPKGSPREPARVEADCAPIVIARLNADTTPWTFKAAVQEHVLSIEQQYWSLSSEYVRRWACGVAVQVAEDAVKREEARLEAGTGAIPDVAAARQRLEKFRLELATATSDVITTERQLRNLLGLKPTDGRRIVPVTAPIESCVAVVWDRCLSEMMSHHPDVVRDGTILRVKQLQYMMVRGLGLPQSYVEIVADLSGLGHDLDDSMYIELGDRGFNDRQALDIIRRWEVKFQQVKHQTTHALARFFLEVDANHKQFKVAGRHREATRQNLEAQRDFYEQGKVTVESYLNALSYWSQAVALEAQYRSSYNIALAAVEEAKGTLLEHEGITVLGPPRPRKAYIQARDAQQGRFPIPFRPEAAPAPKADDQAVPTSAEVPAKPEAKAEEKPQGYSLRLPLGDLGAVQVRVRVWKATVGPKAAESAR
jgi:hypothetical protein